jgi:hypothetical protein
MNVFTCAEVLDRLEAYHDEELPVSDQVAVASHIGWCRECAGEFAGIRLVATSLRASAPGGAVVAGADAASLRSSVVNRAKAEEAVAFVAQVRGMFQDMHLVYAVLGAGLASLLAFVCMVGTLQFVSREQPGSLAAMISVLASPGSNQNPVTLSNRIRMPRPLDDGFTADAGDMHDAIFALAAVVTREGRVANLELLPATGTPAVAPGSEDAKAVEDLLGAASRAQFEPASVGGAPVAVNMVWIVAHTTVKAPPGPLELPSPRVNARKRVAGNQAPSVLPVRA